jgi:hypothetical protein
VGFAEENAGTPGADCTPGTPGKENKSLNDGSDVDELEYAVFPVSAKVSDEQMCRLKVCRAAQAMCLPARRA